MSVLVAEFTNIQEAIEAEKALPAGAYEVRASLYPALSQERLNELYERLISHSVQVLAITQTIETPSVLTIKAYKPASGRGVAFAWPLLVPVLGIVGGATILGITLWRSTAILDRLTVLAIPLGIMALIGLVIVYKK